MIRKPSLALLAAIVSIRAAANERRDTNHEGVLPLDEDIAGLKGPRIPEQRFKNVDENGDGQLSREELITLLEK